MFSCRAQSQLEILNKYSNDIVGVWTSTDEPSHKLVFKTDNSYNIYINNNLEGHYFYKSDIDCEINSSNTYDIYLIVKENSLSTDYSCSIINNITINSSGKMILSITTERGQLETYIKQ
ncbi:MAG: hypothetical protein ACPGPB_03765 [Flavobacteriaceae bacterium]